MKKLLLITVLLLLSLSSTFGQKNTIDPRLEGIWVLESFKQEQVGKNRKNQVTTNLTIEEIEKLRELPNDVFLMLYIFENNIGLCSIKEHSVTNKSIDVNAKGWIEMKKDSLSININKLDGIQKIDYKYQVETSDVIKLNLSTSIYDSKTPTIQYEQIYIYLLKANESK